LLTGSFIKIWHQEPSGTFPVHQETTCPSSLFLKSRRTWILLTDLIMVSYGRKNPTEANVNQEKCQDSTFPPSLLLDSRWTWTFLMDLEMVSDRREPPSEVYMFQLVIASIEKILSCGCWWWPQQEPS